jgi:hypothetical protein
MSETKWTPGPWQQGMRTGANANCIYKQVGPELHDVDAIAMVYGIRLNTSAENVTKRWSEGVSNARLISAAPDLYDALEECKRVLSDLQSTQLEGTRTRAAWEKARTALAKARGE